MKTKFFKNKKCLTGCCLLGLITQGAYAQESRGGLFVEPSISYEMGYTNVNYPSPFTNSSGQSDGFGLGARLGFHLNESFFLALDARYAKPQFSDSAVNYNATATSTNWGPVVGMQMPNIGLRVWGSYILGGDLDPEKSGSLDIKLQKANGYRVGTGFRIAAVSLNLEYQQLKYGEAALEQIGPFTSSSTFNNVNLEDKAWLVSVSFPLEL